MPRYSTEHIDRRKIDTRAMSTAEWDMVDAQLRERAFFMAGVNNARILQDFKDAAHDIAAGRLTLNEARKQLRAALREAGYSPTEQERGGIHDLSSRRRMEVTLETNVALARGWQQREQMKQDKSQPALRLYRAQEAKQPRDWERRWLEAAEAVGWEGVARKGMVALIESPIWVELSRFGQPYPPFDFGSKMRVRAVPYEDCKQLGLLPPEYEPTEAEPEAQEEQPAETEPPEEATPEVHGKEVFEMLREMGEIHDPSIVADKVSLPDYAVGQVNKAVASLNEHEAVSLRGMSRAAQEELIRATQGIARVEGDRLVMLDKNGTRKYDWQEIGKIITMPGPDGVPNYQAEVARQAINDSGQINYAAPDDPRRAVLLTLRERIIPTVSDGSDPGMTIHRALSYSDEKQFCVVLNRMLKNGAYTPKAGFVVDSWNNNQATIYAYTKKRYSIILHMEKYQSRRRIDGLYKYIKTDKQKALGISSEGESWMPGEKPLPLAKRNIKVTKTDDGRVTVEVWVEEREEKK